NERIRADKLVLEQENERIRAETVFLKHIDDEGKNMNKESHEIEPIRKESLLLRQENDCVKNKYLKKESEQATNYNSEKETTAGVKKKSDNINILRHKESKYVGFLT
ncbi:16320_t:CDS:1, partial [Gigaspora margarita]